MNKLLRLRKTNEHWIFFIFDSQEEYERKKRMSAETNAVEKVYAGGDGNFSELMETVASSGDTIYRLLLKILETPFSSC